MSITLMVALSEAAGESHTPGWVYGVFTGVILLALLAITLIFGKGRPHS
jgi:hypothetical protein